MEFLSAKSKIKNDILNKKNKTYRCLFESSVFLVKCEQNEIAGFYCKRNIMNHVAVFV